MTNNWLTAREVSEIIDISIPTVHAFIKKGLISAYRYNHRVKIHLNDFKEFLKKSKTDGNIELIERKIEEMMRQREEDWKNGLIIPRMKH